MANILPLDTIAAKWMQVSSQRSADYEQGVRNPRRDWMASTAAAATAYADGVSDAIADGRWSRGINKAGTAKWMANTIALGIPRWPQGIRNAQPAYRAGFEPYHAVITRTTLPPRYGRGDTRNYQRSQVMGDALHAARLAQP